MNGSESRRYALGICATVSVLSGCGALPSPVGAPGTIGHGASLHRMLPASAYQVVYSFGGASAHPYAGLINVNGTMYGAASGAPKHRCGGKICGGTVFSVTPTGTEKVLHRFGGSPDGYSPFASLVNVKGTLYGTTFAGGTNGYGTIFSVTTTGTEKVLYNFSGGSDGAYPYAGLTFVNGTLYGTTSEGGSGCSPGCGTIFSVTTTGTEKVLHSFSSGSDGSSPQAGLTYTKGRLYGTTTYGGAGCSGPGCGTVFSVTTTGKEKVLHIFTGSSDGAVPWATLVDVKGTLYGTTEFGGGTGCSYSGCGTVFSVTTTGKEKVLHSFGVGSDGAEPLAGLFNEKGTLFGTTSGGGGTGCEYGLGCGTIFSITTTGLENVLYSFGGGSDGAAPQAALINVSGTLYGTTVNGGSSSKCRFTSGCGTVFAFTQ